MKIIHFLQRVVIVYSLLLPSLIPSAMARVRATRSPELIEADFDEYDFPTCKQFQSITGEIPAATCSMESPPMFDQAFLEPIKTMELEAEKEKYLKGLKEFLKSRLEPEIMKRELHQQCMKMDLSAATPAGDLKAYCQESLHGDPDDSESKGYIHYLRSTVPELRLSMALMKTHSFFHPLKSLDIPKSISEVEPPEVSRESIEAKATTAGSANTGHQLFPIELEHESIGTDKVPQAVISKAEKDLITHRFLQEAAAYEQDFRRKMAVPEGAEGALLNIDPSQRALVETNGNQYHVKGTIERSGNIEPVSDSFWGEACSDFTFSIAETIEARSGMKLAQLNSTQLKKEHS